MRVGIFIFFTFVLLTNSSAVPMPTAKKKLESNKLKLVTRCSRHGVPNETGARTKFVCGEGKRKFLAYCDLAVDPLEFNQSKLEIQQAQWAKHAKNEGIEGSFGFISCKKR